MAAVFEVDRVLGNHGRYKDKKFLLVKHRRIDLDWQEAQREIVDYFGEPSPAFHPPADTQAHMVYDARLENARANVAAVRSADAAKKRAENINTMLQNPQEFKEASGFYLIGFVRRNLERIKRFTKTLQNKGKLHPQMAEIILPK